MTTTYNADQLTDFVNEWISNNPERLGQLYDDYAAELNWKKEAIRRIENRDVLTESGADILENWATEAEEAAIASIGAKKIDEIELKSLAAEDEGFILYVNGGYFPLDVYHGVFYTETEAQRAQQVVAYCHPDAIIEILTLEAAVAKSCEE